MHDVAFLGDLALVMLTAACVAVLFRRLGQSLIPGYLLAGVLIGPHVPVFPIIRDEAAIKTLAELGVVFLMFSLGLEFNIRRLREIGWAPLWATLFGTMLTVWIGHQTGRVLGWGQMDCFFLGGMLAISSTIVSVKTLRDLGRMQTPEAPLVVGILIVEDLLAVGFLALLSGIAMTGTLRWDAVAATASRMVVFLVAALVAGLPLVPRLLRNVARFKSDEVLLVAAVGFCFGLAILTAWLGYSAALGAFLAGALIAEAREGRRVEALVGPLRDMFSAVFFVAMGLLIDPTLLWDYALPIVLVTAAVVLGKIATYALGAFVAGCGARTSFKVGLGLAHIGEFSFVIAALGASLGVTSPFLYPIIACVSVLSAFLSPNLMRHADGLSRRLAARVPRALGGYAALYSRWVDHLGRSLASNDPIQRQLRRVAIQMFLNLSLIAAIFIGAVFLSRGVSLPWPARWGGPSAVFWVAAMLLASPIYVAALRKIQAVALLLGEMSVQGLLAGAHKTGIRVVVSSTISLVGIAGLCLFTLLLSAALLPPRDVLVVLLAALIAATFFLWNFLVRLYAKAQIAIHEALADPPPEPPEPLPSLLKGAEMESVTLPPGSPAVGRRIRDLSLRAAAGASIIGIERDGESLVNPEPDEVLRSGDRVFLVGTPENLARARDFLGGDAAA